jgi:hypothetical protein
MSESDRELLELAAKAVGLQGFEWVSDPFFEGLERRNFEDDGSELQSQTWNPLANDGDAFRLMVALLAESMIDVLRLEFGGGGTQDPLPDARLAITRAAAEIGRRMA